MPPSVVLREMAAQMVRRASPLSLASMAEQANRTPPDKGPSIYVQSAAPGARVQEVFMWERDEDNSWRCTALEEHFGSSSAAKSAARPFHEASGSGGGCLDLLADGLHVGLSSRDLGLRRGLSVSTLR